MTNRESRFLTAVLLAAIAGRSMPAEELEKSKIVMAMNVQYKVVLPDHYDPMKTYPGILAFGGGPQTMDTVDGVLNRYLRHQAEKRGYIAIAVAAPNGQLFFEGGASIFPDFLNMLLRDYKIENNKFHIVGPSNGGIAAFHVAAQNPQYFSSVTAFPGYMWDPSTAKLNAISKMCVFMYVGENDPYKWHAEMKKEADYLRAAGTNARYSVEKGQPHRLATLEGEDASRLFDNFDEARKGCGK